MDEKGEPEDAPEVAVKGDPTPSVPTRRRRGVGGWLLWLVKRTLQGLLLVLLVLLAVVVGWLQSDDFQRRVQGVAEHLIEDRLGEQVTLNRVTVRFWPPGVDAVGIHLFDAETGDTIVSAERVRIPLVLTARGPAIGQLHLTRPQIELHLGEDGKLREFRRVKRPEKPQPLRRLPWSSLRVDDGSLRLELPDGLVEIDDLALAPTRGPITDVSGELALEIRGLSQQTRFEWPGVVLGPEEIEIPDLRLALDVLQLSGSGRIDLDGPLVADLVAHVELEELNPLLTEPRKAHGVLDADVHIEGLPSDPTLHLTVLGTRLGADVPGVATPLLTYEFGDATASVIARKDGLQIEQAVLHWGEGELVAWGFVTPDKKLVDGHVTGQDVRLAPLLQGFDAAPTPWVDLRADAEARIEGSLDPLRLEGTFDFGVADLTVGDRPVADPRMVPMLSIPHAHARGTLILEKDHVYLSAPTIRGPRTEGSATVDIGFGPKGPLDLEMDVRGADLEDFQPLANVGLKGRGAISGRIWGPFNQLQLVGEGDVEGFEVLGIRYADRLVARLSSPDMKSIRLDEAMAELRSSSYHGRYAIDFKPPISMSTAIEIDRGRVEDMVQMFIDVDGLRGDLTGTLTLDGPLFDMDGEAHLAMKDVELYGERFEVGEGHGYMDAGRFTLDDLRVRRDDGRAGITIRGSVEREWKLDMELLADGLRLEHLDRLAPYDLPLSGRLSVVSRITNTLFDPSPDGRIWVTDVRYAGEPIASSVLGVDTEGGVAAYTGRLVGDAARIDGTLGLWGQQPYSLTARLDHLPAHLLHPKAVDGTPLRAVISGDVEISGHFGEQWSPVTLAGTFPEVELGYGNHVLRNETPWTYHQDGNGFALEGFNLHGGTTEFRLDAQGGDELALAGDGRVDLDLLRAVVPGLDRASGTADVVLYAVGARPNVEAAVDIEVDAELLRHSSAPLTFEDTRASISVREDRIEIRSVTGGLGGGTFSGGGAIEAVDWLPTRYDIAMSVDDAEVQWVDSLPAAIGDGTFRFDGPTGALLLSGDVQVTDMTFSERIDWEDWVVEYREQMLVDPAASYEDEPMFSMNVALRAPGTIKLRNNVAEGSATADLRIIGDTVRPGLVGTVNVSDDTLAFLQDREFRVDRGTLLFNDPWTWDPQLDISLLTDIDSREQRYRVDYQVYGPFSNWKTSTRSDPPLAQSDVNALLWFGVTLDELEEMGELSSAVVQGVADLLVTDFFISGKAGDVGEDLPEFLFDRIDLATGVNARGDYSPEPRLVVEKRIDDDLGVDLGVDLRWELNLVRPDDTYVSVNKRIGGIWSLSGWYATLQRDRVLPIGGAYGVDVTARWEIE